MKKLQKLMSEWKGMAPDNPRDRMSQNQVWLMQDYIPRLLGSSLESRQGWTYYGSSTPMNGYVTSQFWLNTVGGNHHLACTPTTAYNLDALSTGGSPRAIVGAAALWPMTSLYEYILIPQTGNQLPIILQYKPGQSVETVITVNANTPRGKVASTWQSRFILANEDAHPNRVSFLPPEWTTPGDASPAWDVKAWLDSSADVTGLATTRNALLIFHEGTVERLRGTRVPGAGVDPDVWIEPLVGLGGCNEPHTICYWNDNVLFADARGVYLTDGTTIRDISTQGGVGREWRKAYDPIWRVAAGVVFDQYVVAMVDLTNKLFKKCFVADLYSRNWTVFTNIPCSSLLASAGEVERLFGGDLNGRVLNLSSMWTEADPTTNTLDGNGTPVLPQLETAWYRMSDEEEMKRVKNVYFSFDLDEADGQMNVYVCEQPQPRRPSDWILLKTIKEGDLLDDRGQPIQIDGYRRRRIALGREFYGFAFKIETVGTLKNLKLFDLSAELVPAREQSYAYTRKVAS